MSHVNTQIYTWHIINNEKNFRHYLYFHYYYLHYSSKYGSLIITCFLKPSPIFPHCYLLPLCEADGPPHLNTYYVPGMLTGILQIYFTQTTQCVLIYYSSYSLGQIKFLKIKFTFIGGLRTCDNCHIKSFFPLSSLEKAGIHKLTNNIPFYRLILLTNIY